MKCEYLLFNVLVAAGPVVFSFDRRVHFVSRWPPALLAIVIVMIPFGIWDSLVVNRHWFFNEQFTLDMRLAGLPLEEWLFFMTMPFAALFVWERIFASVEDRRSPLPQFIRLTWIIAIPAGLVAYLSGKEYTGLVLIALGLVAVLDVALRANLLLQRRTYVYMAVMTAFTLLFNGYLTWRPVVLYEPAYQVSLLVVTIPIEDFAFGWSLVLANLIAYEKLKALPLPLCR